MKINLTEWEGYVGVQEEILLKSLFSFLFYFNVKRVAQEEWFLLLRTFFLFVSYCVDDGTNAVFIPEKLHIHFENEI